MADDFGIDQEAFKKLSAHVQAQQDANRLKQSEITILRRKEQIGLDEREATVKLRAEVERMVTALRELGEDITANIAADQLSRNKIDRLSSEVGDLEQGFYAVLSRDLAEMRRSKDRLGQHIDRRKQLQLHYGNLEKLEEQAASYGPLEIPLKVSNQIEALKARIAEIEEN